ncbi:hypothetical protein [Natrialba taiwanensis]|uniref:Small CPxCG-related zinc finger protein n=1 Tax=Natrialba taiwanensis DSM 12281 TaxID=1230458 RepID=L9ZMB9_9EURY|nr:hypothetical protein [Natrialba taiwanensis]ELY87201.1 hypothetical protein C484_17611 [Natrialba taiwanensis DSM 12281]
MTDEFTSDGPDDSPDAKTDAESEPSDDDGTFPRCPRCNTPIVRRTMIGPGEAVAGPCGCRVAPVVETKSEPDSE